MGTSTNQPREEFLWHFTSTEHLPQILTQCPFLTAGHTSFLSDPEDSALSRRAMALSVELVKALLAIRSRGIKVPDEVSQSVESLMKTGGIAPSFVLCMTESTDNPKMWDAYTKSGGVAIGFDKKRLTAFFKKNDGNVGSCSYDNYSELEKEIDHLEAVVKQVSALSSLNQPGGQKMKKLAALCKELRADLQPLAKKLLFQKKGRFSFEQETRIAFVFPGGVPKSRLRFFGNTPRLRFKWDEPIKSFVREIKISPFGDVSKTWTVAALVANEIGLSLDHLHEVKMV